MLLAVDIGNTNVTFGLFADGPGAALVADGRCETRAERTVDEYAVFLHGLFELWGRTLGDISAGIISSVVPAATAPVTQLFQRRLSVTPILVGPDSKTGLTLLYENPRELGSDRLVNAVAAHARNPGGALVVDFGTATKFDVVTDRGEYAGGAIAPGLMMVAGALTRDAAKLPRVPLSRPATAIGKSTLGSMQSGLVFGYVGLVDALVQRIRSELSFAPRVIATGGLSPLIAAESRTIEECDEHLTLRGLQILHERNHDVTRA